MNRLSIVHKGVIVLLLCMALGFAILKKTFSPTLILKNRVENNYTELAQKRIQLSLIDNLSSEQLDINKYADIQSFIIASVNADSNVSITRFSEIEKVKDSNYIHYDFTVSGTQSDLLVWFNTFENDFNHAIVRASSFESKRNSDDLFLNIYLRSVQK